MREYIRSTRALLRALSVTTLCATTLVAAACSKKADDTALATDSALGRDLALAARDSTVQPELKDVPAAPTTTTKPATTRPRPATPKPTAPPPATTPTPTPEPPKAAEPVTGTVAAGTSMTFTSNSKICTNTNQVGDKFTADLAQAVPATNGMSIPAGATGTFEVTSKRTAKNSNDSTYLKVRLISVQYGGRTYPVESTIESAATTRIRGASKSTDAKKVAGGAIIGAIAGQVIGKDTKGTVIGAAAGAAAGTAAAVATADYETCLNGGSAVVVRLDSPATIRMAVVNNS